MAFLSATCYRGDLSVDVIYRKDKPPFIRAKYGDGCIGMDCAEAVHLRDDLSRAITEAATAAAKAVQAEGAEA